jgi:hypothetical protein
VRTFACPTPAAARGTAVGPKPTLTAQIADSAVARIYIASAESRRASEVADAMLSEGVARDHIRVISRSPTQLSAPVSIETGNIESRRIIAATFIGTLAGLVLGIPLLQFGEFGLAPLAVVVIIGAVSGALIALWGPAQIAQESPELRQALQRGETLVVLDVADRRVAELQEKVKSRHPQVAVLGQDPGGTPPFP